MIKQIEDLSKRIEVIENILGIKQWDDENITRIKAIIKRGSNDFNNEVHENPFENGSKENDWWSFGYKYAKELDEQKC